VRAGRPGGSDERHNQLRDSRHGHNVVLAGLGGQGVIKASDILADAALRAGLDVKKSEIHGMSQRGGSVTSDVRFGGRVLSPMVPRGEADFLVVLAPSEVEVARPLLRRAAFCSPRT
jgi:indolepyruvate ferredoxin oxidoreductase beta subunit